MPSRSDSFGIVFLEAWQQGKAVIGARAGGIPGVIDDGRNGVLVEFGDVPALTKAIQQLIRQPDMAAELGRCGQEKVKAQYTWPGVARAVLQQYDQLGVT